MLSLWQSLRTLAENEAMVLIATFAAAVLLALIVFLAIGPQMEKRRRLRRLSDDGGGSPAGRKSGNSGDINDELQSFYDTFLKGEKNSLKMRLIQAGYFSPGAIHTYNVIRFFVALGLFLLTYTAVSRLSASSTVLTASMFAALIGALGIYIPSFVLDRFIRSRQERYRQIFPDFVDMMIVCADAGLSVEASATRVAREYLVRDRAFGIQLGVMMLEVRAGKRLRDALHGLSERIGLEEAKVLAMLFKQSEELGVSMTKALRTHSKEMRQMRILRAEEKANALPVKMLMPLGAFIFPVTLVIVVTPIMIQLISMLKTMMPGL
jgi:tight adherence protein C